MRNGYLGTQEDIIPNALPSSFFLPTFYYKHEILWSGIFLWSIGAAYPGCVSSQQLPLHRGCTKNRKALGSASPPQK